MGFLGPALCLSQLGGISSPVAAVLLLCAAQGLDAFSQAGLYAIHSDIAPRHSGAFLGLTNTAGVLAGVVGSAATGHILQSTGGDWQMVWNVAIGLYCVGAVVWNSGVRAEALFD